VLNTDLGGRPGAALGRPVVARGPRSGDDAPPPPRASPAWSTSPRASCRLTVTHDQLPAGANAEPYGGWPMILSGLKTLLETGEQLDTPGSLRCAQR
jgi:hypothetical protein